MKRYCCPVRYRLFPLAVIAVIGQIFPSALGDAVAAMTAGAFRPLVTSNAINNYRMGALAEPIFAYAGSGCWDPGTRQMLYAGAPHCYPARFVLYSESDNNWREEPMPDGMGCHAYDHQTMDTSGHFYWMNYQDAIPNRFDVQANSWMAPLPASSGNYGSLDFFPELNALVRIQNGSVYLYRLNEGIWRTLASGLTFGGIHNIAQYCAPKSMILFGGGSGDRHLYKLDTALQITPLQPAPFDIGISTVSVTTADPVTGDIIVIRSDSLYRYDADNDAWRGIVACPAAIKNNVHAMGAVPISTYGVIALLSVSSYPVLLYKYAGGAAIEKDAAGSPVQAPILRAEPNPFHSGVTVSCVLAPGQSGEYRIFNVHGREVFKADLRDAKIGKQGILRWNGRDRSGSPLPAGCYVGTLRLANGRRATHKLMMMR